MASKRIAVQQHCLHLQSIIARALDNNEYVLLSSFDLSSAFDVVDINLLLKRLKNGAPLRFCLTDRTVVKRTVLLRQHRWT